MPIVVQNISIEINKEGFLLDQSQWSPEVGKAIAKAHGVELTEAHWEILILLRDFCEQGNKPPSMRQLSREIRAHLGPDKAKSIYLMRLFGSSPAKMAAQLAGLPKPKNCL